MDDSPNKLDLNSVAAKKKFTLNIEEPEGPDEIASRLRREEAEETGKRLVTMASAFVGLAALLVVVIVLLYVCARSAATLDDRKLIIPILGSLGTAWLGYIAGKGSK